MWEVQCELAVTMSVQESFKCPRDPKALLASKNGVRQVTACAVAAALWAIPRLPKSSLCNNCRRQSATKDGASLAVIVLAAGTARHLVDPNGWDGETEGLLALEALHDDRPAAMQI